MHTILLIISGSSTTPLQFTHEPVHGLHILKSCILHNTQEGLADLGEKKDLIPLFLHPQKLMVIHQLNKIMMKYFCHIVCVSQLNLNIYSV